jgi:transcriptional regulator with XRE-family HTH domain
MVDEDKPVEALRVQLGLKPEEFARALKVSSGYAGDLRSNRRTPSLRVAAELDRLAGEARFLPQVLAEKMSARAA